MFKEFDLKRTNSVMLFFVLGTVILYYGSQILIPVFFAILFSTLMTPLANKLEEKGLSRGLTSVISVLILLVSLGLVIFLVAVEISHIIEDSDQIGKNLGKMKTRLQSYLTQQWDVPETAFAKAKEKLKSVGKNVGDYLGTFLTGMVSILSNGVIVLIMTFLLLYQRGKYERFFLQLMPGKNVEDDKQVLDKVSKVAQQYLVGRAMSVAIITILTWIGLMFTGIQNPFLLAFISGVLTIVPYVGSIIGSLIPVMMAFVTMGDFGSTLGVVAVVVVVQSIDNYFVEPFVIGGEVNLSALATIVSIFIGGVLWSVAGMILFIPLFAMIKIVCSEIDPLKPVGLLLGDQGEGRQSKRIADWFKKKFGKKK